MLWGILGSYFGISEIGGTSLILWFNPQNEPLVMLVLTMIIGVVHLSFGLVMKCIPVL